MSRAAEKQEKQEWALDKLELDNARKLRGIYFIDLEDGESQETVMNARKKMEALLEAAFYPLQDEDKTAPEEATGK